MAKISSDDRPKRVNVYDCAALFALGDSLKDDQGKAAKINYARAKELSARARADHGLAPAQVDIAFASIDPHSEPQRRFLDALRAIGIEQEAIDYRHASIVSGGPERAERQPASLSAQISYLLGLLADRQNAEIVVWSPNFDLYYPLRDFVEVRSGKAVVAYFRRFLDARWAQCGLFEGKSIQFFDLEDYAEELLGIDLKQIEEKTVKRVSGLRKL